MEEELHGLIEGEPHASTKASQESVNYNLCFPTKMYTRSSIVQDSKKFAKEKLKQAEQWYANKKTVYKELAEKDMERSS